MRASSRKRLTAALSRARSSRRSFSATSRASEGSWARYTTPMPPRAISCSTRQIRSGGRLVFGGASFAARGRLVKAARRAPSSSGSVGGRSPETVLMTRLLGQESHEVLALAFDSGVGLGDVEGDDLLEHGGELAAALRVLAVERFQGDVPLARDVRDLAVLLEHEAQELDAPERERSRGLRAFEQVRRRFLHDLRRPRAVEQARRGLVGRRQELGLERVRPRCVEFLRARLLDAPRNVADAAEEGDPEARSAARRVPPENALVPQALDEHL